MANNRSRNAEYDTSGLAWVILLIRRKLFTNTSTWRRQFESDCQLCCAVDGDTNLEIHALHRCFSEKQRNEKLSPRTYSLDTEVASSIKVQTTYTAKLHQIQMAAAMCRVKTKLMLGCS